MITPFETPTQSGVIADSALEVLEKEIGDPAWELQRKQLSSAHAWYGFHSPTDLMRVDDACEVVRHGWKEGTDRLVADVARLRGQIRLKTRVSGRRIVRRHHGDEVDLQKVWSGSLDTAWRTNQRYTKSGSNQLGRVILVCRNNMRHSVDSSMINLTMALTALVCEGLIRRGASPEIWYIGESSGTFLHSKKTCFAALRIKDSSQPFNLSSVATLLSAGAYRTLGFKLRFMAPQAKSSGVSKTLGSSLDTLALPREVLRLWACSASTSIVSIRLMSGLVDDSCVSWTIKRFQDDPEAFLVDNPENDLGCALYEVTDDPYWEHKKTLQ